MAPFSEANPAWTGRRIAPIENHEKTYDESQRHLLHPGPRRVGHFSLSGPLRERKREFHDDMRSLRKLNSFHRTRLTKPFNLDREDGRFAVQLGEKTDRGQNDGLHSLLKWILSHRVQFDQLRLQNKLHIVGRRALFRRLGVMRSVSYDWKNERGWLIAACRFQGVIYLSSFTTDDKLQELRKKVAGDTSKSWVVKQKGMAKSFKHFMKTPPKIISSSINLNEKFYLTMLMPLKTAAGTQLGFLYDAQIDGYDEQLGDINELPINCYDCRSVREPNHVNKMKKMLQTKYPDWWTRCYATGERGIIVGYRNEQEKVGVCQAIDTEDLVKPCTFEPADIVGCLRDVLQELRDRIVQADYDEKLYLLRWQPEFGREIRIAELNAAESDYKVLPQWFVEGMTNEPMISEAVERTTTGDEAKSPVLEQAKTNKTPNSETVEESVQSYAENLFSDMRARKKKTSVGRRGRNTNNQLHGPQQQVTNMPVGLEAGDANRIKQELSRLQLVTLFRKRGVKDQQSASS